jgi:hypothetical protein
MKFMDLKLRMVVLWIIAGIGVTAALVFVLIEPARLDYMMAEIERMGIIWSIVAPLFGLIPLIMAFLTVVLKDRANRITNRTLSIIYIALILWDFIQGLLFKPVVHQILVMGSVVVVTAYLIFYSWKWPVEKT